MVGYFREECVPLQMSVGGATACVVKRQGSSFSRSLNFNAIMILLSLSKKKWLLFSKFNCIYYLFMSIKHTESIRLKQQAFVHPLTLFLGVNCFQGT